VWPTVVAFAIFATLAELLAINVGYSDGGAVTPSSPVFWAATALVGPLPTIVIVVVCGVLGESMTFASLKLGRALRARVGPDGRGLVLANLERIGSVWEQKGNMSLWNGIQMTLQYVSALVLIVGLGGMTYCASGGRFLIETAGDFNTLSHFILPFLGLVGVSVVVDNLLNLAVMAVIDPIPGAQGVYGFYLRMKLFAVSAALPVLRAEMFLVSVAVILAYLYANIRAWGFVLAAMPVVALRDFFYQWVETKGAYEKTITTLATYMQQYHPYTRGHLKRVADLSERLARELRLPVESIRHISTAGFLHDIGKIGVSEQILDKPGRPSDEEWEMIKAHPVKGADIVSHIEYFEGIINWIKYHHKWYDGGGYPAANGDGQVPIEAAIIGVADAFDAMTDDRELTLTWKCDVCGYKPDDGTRPEVCPSCSATKNRTYRDPKTLDEAMEELRRGTGTQFHPQVVKAFFRMVERDGLHVDAE